MTIENVDAEAGRRLTEAPATSSGVRGNAARPESLRERLAVRDDRFNLFTMWATPRNEDYARHNAHLVEALRENKREGMVLTLRARFVAILVASALLLFGVPWPGSLYYIAFLALFGFLGWLQLRVGRVEQSSYEILLLMLDVVLLVFMMVAPNPFLDVDWPASTAYHFDAYKFLFVFLAATTIGYSWRTVFSFGTWTVIVWLAAALIVWLAMGDHGALRERLLLAVGGDLNFLDVVDVTRVDWLARIEEVAVLMLVTIILGVNGFRMNRLLLRQAEAARERSNLARHFAPTMVERMAARDDPLGEVRAQDAGVVFVDIVGFTAHAESASPEVVVATLRRFHARVEEVVFRHGGTLDKFLGDGAMITFGTPEPRPDDGARALACIRDLVAVDPGHGLRTAVGGHYGSVVLGDIGSARRLEFATIGDTVNVACRLEETTRAHGVAALVSRALYEAGGEPGGYRSLDWIFMRGRGGGVEALTLAD